MTAAIPRERVTGLIAAAGSGERIGGRAKAFLESGGLTLLERAVTLLSSHCSQILAGVPREELDRGRALVGDKARVIAGGATRQDTLANLLAEASGEMILVHDVARPFASSALVADVLATAARYGAAAPAVPVPSRDSLSLSEDGWLGPALPRGRVIGTQTPYAVRRELLLRAYEAARAENKQETSTMTLLTRAGIPVRLLAGEPANWKITYTADWEQACALLADDS